MLRSYDGLMTKTSSEGFRMSTPIKRSYLVTITIVSVTIVVAGVFSVVLYLQQPKFKNVVGSLWDDRPTQLWDGSKLAGSNGLNVWTIDDELVVPPTVSEVMGSAGIDEFHYPAQSRLAWGTVRNVLDGSGTYFWIYDVPLKKLTTTTSRTLQTQMIQELEAVNQSVDVQRK